MYRPYCEKCKENFCAINYVRNTIRYFRKYCAACLRKKNKTKPVPPQWVKVGYKKKTKCDRCNFLAKNSKTQLRVYYIDGNLRNNDWNNLKTICLNCQAAIEDSNAGWKPAELVPDY